MKEAEQLVDGIKAGGLYFKHNFVPIKLFFDKSVKRHYHIPDEDLICDLCEEKIRNVVLFRFNWSKKKSIAGKFCVDCIPKLKSGKYPIVQESIIAVITNKIPKNSYPIFIKPPSISNLSSQHSVFDAGGFEFRKEDMCETNSSKLIYSGRKIPEVSKYQIEEGNENISLIEFNSNYSLKLNEEQKRIIYKIKLGKPLTFTEKNSLRKMDLQAKQDDIDDIDEYLNHVFESIPLIENKERKLLK